MYLNVTIDHISFYLTKKRMITSIPPFFTELTVNSTFFCPIPPALITTLIGIFFSNSKMPRTTSLAFCKNEVLIRKLLLNVDILEVFYSLQDMLCYGFELWLEQVPQQCVSLLHFYRMCRPRLLHVDQRHKQMQHSPIYKLK